MFAFSYINVLIFFSFCASALIKFSVACYNRALSLSDAFTSDWDGGRVSHGSSDTLRTDVQHTTHRAM